MLYFDESLVFVQLQVESQQFFLLAPFVLVDERLTSHSVAQLEQLMLLDIIEGPQPAARPHVHLLVFSQRQ